MKLTRKTRAPGDPNKVFALTVIDRALDDIEHEGDEEALRWVREPDTGGLSLKAACRVAGVSVGAVQSEARERLGIYYADDDPIAHDRIDDPQTLLDHEQPWIRLDAAAERWGVSESVIGGAVSRGQLESVLAPKSDDHARPVRYVLFEEARQAFR